MEIRAGVTARITDSYVRSLLHLKKGEASPELIQAKREQLILRRLGHEIKQAINQSENQ